MFKQLIIITLSIFYYNTAYTDEWNDIRFEGLTPGQEYNISSGSGFFVNSHHIVTNKHVVDKCTNIAIRGAITPSKAVLQLVDPELDLAILYTESTPPKIPYLRMNYNQLTPQDILFTIGYPLEYGKTGKFLVSQTSIIEVVKHPKHGFSSINFVDVVDHGNSGGPILDKNSNISGVVTAQISTTNTQTGETSSIGIAIGLDGLINFLTKNQISFSSNTSYDIFTNYNPTEMAKNYMVNIHCIH